MIDAMENQWGEKKKPIVLFPTLSRDGDFSPTANPRHLRRFIREEMKLFMNRLNHAVSQWRRSAQRSARPMGKGKSPARKTALIRCADLWARRRWNNSARPAPKRMSGGRSWDAWCSSWEARQKNGQACDRTLYLAARTLRQHMKRADLGVCLDESTLAVVKPSSPLGECWIWAENAQRRFDGTGAVRSGQVAVVGVGVHEIAAAGALRPP